MARSLLALPQIGFPASPKESEPKRRHGRPLYVWPRPAASQAMSLLGVRLAHTARYTRANASMQKILAVDRLPETVVVLDEGRDEFMQAGLNRDKFNGPLEGLKRLWGV
jgi:hypothetical protein